MNLRLNFTHNLAQITSNILNLNNTYRQKHIQIDAYSQPMRQNPKMPVLKVPPLINIHIHTSPEKDTSSHTIIYFQSFPTSLSNLSLTRTEQKKKSLEEVEKKSLTRQGSFIRQWTPREVTFTMTRTLYDFVLLLSLWFLIAPFPFITILPPRALCVFLAL